MIFAILILETKNETAVRTKYVLPEYNREEIDNPLQRITVINKKYLQPV